MFNKLLNILLDKFMDRKYGHRYEAEKKFLKKLYPSLRSIGRGTLVVTNSKEIAEEAKQYQDQVAKLVKKDKQTD